MQILWRSLLFCIVRELWSIICGICIATVYTLNILMWFVKAVNKLAEIIYLKKDLHVKAADSGDVRKNQKERRKLEQELKQV